MLRPTIAAALLIAVSPLAARAADTTRTLEVHHAFCELCPSIVTKALERVSGVRTVEVTKPNDAGDMAATVTFDDAKTDVAKLIATTTNAGYPADLKN